MGWVVECLQGDHGGRKLGYVDFNFVVLLSDRFCPKVVKNGILFGQEDGTSKIKSTQHGLWPTSPCTSYRKTWYPASVPFLSKGHIPAATLWAGPRGHRRCMPPLPSRSLIWTQLGQDHSQTALPGQTFCATRSAGRKIRLILRVKPLNLGLCFLPSKVASDTPFLGRLWTVLAKFWVDFRSRVRSKSQFGQQTVEMTQLLKEKKHKPKFKGWTLLILDNN